ncbi:hypothetical protein [Azospirillum doebereinerae]|uniref:Uncharacterized protein n=1 Tax=Azospirillum doebereinerae TaxID=92933 RepID=A0A3S1CGE7_9PROT|nr:hypothetical protein [Azospirillum doebereinerae]RUQ69380.1 hypothetical protein EJ913_16590 [Azospirillum doebereinerae]
MNAKMLAITAFASLMGIASASHAQTGTVRGNYVGCITEEALDQATQAAVKKDERLFNSLMGKQCIPISGQQFSILDRGFIRSKIRVYVGNNHIDLYTPSEATH